MWRKHVYLLQKQAGSLINITEKRSVISVISSRTRVLPKTSQTRKFSNITSKYYSTIGFHAQEKIPAETTPLEDIKNDCNSFTYRTHTCGELRRGHEGQKVTLCGWVQYSRMSKFTLLRDSYGLTQCIAVEDAVDFSKLPLETVIKIEGTVKLRPMGTVNIDMPTGEIEVVIDKLEILNTAENLPFNLRDYQKPKEQLRIQYRYIDLRFPEMQDILRKRSSMLHSMRRFLVENHGFVEVETPTLFCRTPGGAREFVVPTRHSGLFYSLVQSPQQFKQMLMSGAVDRYFQIARCYRDETTRPDRQPEFTQLDIELSFTTLEGVLSLIENLLFDSFLEDLQKPPFRRITYRKALDQYGSDKPNLAYDLKLQNVTELFEEDPESNVGVYCIAYPRELGKLTAKSKEAIRNLTKKYNTRVVINENLSKALGEEIALKLRDKFGAAALIVCSGDNNNSCLCLGEIREMLASLLIPKNLIKTKDNFEPVWITDFPLFVKDDGKLKTCHHPFTAPHPDDLHLLDTDPLNVRSLAYDIVIKGSEVGGGSVRVHDVKLQEKLLKMLDIDPSTLSHFLNALKSGCPPHAGIALGIDRLMAIACGTQSIRDVIAFPKSHEGKDLLSQAPTVISPEDKEYYHLTSKSMSKLYDIDKL